VPLPLPTDATVLNLYLLLWGQELGPMQAVSEPFALDNLLARLGLDWQPDKPPRCSLRQTMKAVNQQLLKQEDLPLRFAIEWLPDNKVRFKAAYD
jgi:hypothetical protein